METKIYDLKANLKELMIEKNISIKELAYLLNISDKAVYCWINGITGTIWLNIKKVAKILKVKPEEIVVGEIRNNWKSKKEFKPNNQIHKKKYDLDTPCGLKRALEILEEEREYLSEHDKKLFLLNEEENMRESRANELMRKALESIVRLVIEPDLAEEAVKEIKILANETLGKVGSNVVKNYKRDDNER